MNRFARAMQGTLAGCLVVFAASSAAASPQGQASGGQSSRRAEAQQGPLVLQPISSGWVVTPEVKFTTVNGSYGTIVGVSGGWLYDESLFIGAGGYWMVDGSHGETLSYGGFITGWAAPVGSKLRLGVRGLVGWGHAELIEDVAYGYDHHAGPWGGYGHQATQRAWVYQDFWVFEPQATATVLLGKHVALDVAGGYRVTGNNYYGWDNHVNGGFGSVGVRFGPF
jgi:hypothetical protein